MSYFLYLSRDMPSIGCGMMRTIPLLKDRLTCFGNFVIRSEHNNVLTNISMKYKHCKRHNSTIHKS